MQNFKGKNFYCAEHGHRRTTDGFIAAALLPSYLSLPFPSEKFSDVKDFFWIPPPPHSCDRHFVHDVQPHKHRDVEMIFLFGFMPLNLLDEICGFCTGRKADSYFLLTVIWHISVRAFFQILFFISFTGFFGFSSAAVVWLAVHCGRQISVGWSVFVRDYSMYRERIRQLESALYQTPYREHKHIT